jgi:hypothetical protein
MSKNILKFSAKCSDLFGGSLYVNGEHKKEFDGYVPFDLGIGGGDYVELDIDLDTGQIIGWEKPDIEKTLSECEEDDECLDGYDHKTMNPKKLPNPYGLDLSDVVI